MTAVALFVFNRPDLTKRTFEAIRRYQPSELFVVADGPRRGHPDDHLRCEETRAVVENIKWVCDVDRLYSDTNLGLEDRMISGLDHVFAQTGEAIILEDDCLPHPDFFSFATTLLKRYRGDERVAAITGDNFQMGRPRGQSSYYFSRYTHVWGWASWSRAWAHYDREISFWPEWKGSDSWLELFEAKERRYWENIFDSVRDGLIDTWDYQWFASNLYTGGLVATPNTNLVTNIGFGPMATHTTRHDAKLTPRADSLGELTHPQRVVPSVEADKFTFLTHYSGGGNIGRRTLTRIKSRKAWSTESRE